MKLNQMKQNRSVQSLKLGVVQFGNQIIKPTGSEDALTEILKAYTSPSGDQETMIEWFIKGTMSSEEIGLMFVHFKKWKNDGKRGKDAGKWEKVLTEREEEYDKARKQDPKLTGTFNERAFVRAMCSKYGNYMLQACFGETKSYASKCAVYIVGRSGLAQELFKQKAEMLKYMNGNVLKDDMRYRRGISLIELTRCSDEKTMKADYQEVAAWCEMFVDGLNIDTYEEAHNVKDDDEVEFFDIILYYQIQWKSLWSEFAEGGEAKATGIMGDYKKEVAKLKQSNPVIGNNKKNPNLIPKPKNFPKWSKSDKQNWNQKNGYDKDDGI